MITKRTFLLFKLWKILCWELKPISGKLSAVSAPQQSRAPLCRYVCEVRRRTFGCYAHKAFTRILYDNNNYHMNAAAASTRVLCCRDPRGDLTYVARVRDHTQRQYYTVPEDKRAHWLRDARSASHVRTSTRPRRFVQRDAAANYPRAPFRGVLRSVFFSCRLWNPVDSSCVRQLSESFRVKSTDFIYGYSQF